MTTDKSTPTERLLAALKDARGRLETELAVKFEPIAVVGMACRFPGHGQTPEEFWEFLAKGGDAIIEFPEARDAQVGFAWRACGNETIRFGGFLGQVDEFDAEFFGIPPQEALALDPQQRLLLEVSWEAFEGAGMALPQIKGSATGVYLGIGASDYAQLHVASGMVDRINAYSLTGVASSAAAGRLSYFYGLKGPCLALDTACSSSLVAIHTAIQSLRRGEIDQALVGAIQLTLLPHTACGLACMEALSPDHRCQTFDDSANGFVRGEGCGMIVLKRLSDALRDGNRIEAVLRGSAVNQDGDSSGLTAPNGISQRKVIQAALANGRARPEEIDYIEAHGTGTALGDPIELQALYEVFGQSPSPGRVLRIGSVKTNLGHLEAAAGMASLFKVILSMRHQTIPRHLHFSHPNRHVPWNDYPFQVTAREVPWVRNERPRMAGISSFGFSGTNAHLIVQEPPEVKAEAKAYPAHLLVLSAKSDAALSALARATEAAWPSGEVASVCATAMAGRTAFARRAAIVGKSEADMRDGLSRLAAGHAGGCITGRADRRVAKIAFLFPGGGAAYGGMGRELYTYHPVFREAIDQADECLRTDLSPSLKNLLYGESPDEAVLARTEIAQPLWFAVEYALTRLWQSAGVQPSALLGHGLGEYVAATVAGVFDFPDALRLVALRGRLMRGIPAAGIEDFRQALHRIPRHRPALPMVSNLDRVLAADDRCQGVDYWIEQTLSPVRFGPGIGRLLEQDFDTFLEMGPPELLTLGMQAAGAEPRKWLPSLSRIQGDWERMLSTMAELFVGGVDLDPSGLYPKPSPVVRLPHYPFQRKSYWMPPPIGVPVTTTEPVASPPIAPVSITPDASIAGIGGASSRSELEATIYSSLIRILEDCAGTALGNLDPDRNLLELGLDSIMLIQARQLIVREWRVEFELALFFEQASTLRKVTAYIIERTPQLAGAPSPASDAAATRTEETTLQSLAKQLAHISAQLNGIAGGASTAPASLTFPPLAPALGSPNLADPVHLPNQRGKDISRASLSAAQQEYLDAFVERYNRLTAGSKTRTQQYRPTFATSRNLAGFRPAFKEITYQVVAGQGQGSRLTDVDGREYVDFTMGFGVSLFGHNPPFIRQALERELARGFPLGPISDLAGEAAEALCRLAGVERAAFFNSGSEATMNALRVARTITGRNKIVLFEHSYHGTFDGLLALGLAGERIPHSVPMTPGTPAGMVEDVIVLKYGEAESLRLIEELAPQLAAVLVEPVQSRRPDLQPVAFVRELRTITARHHAALIFDEMITGFRCHPGGVQALWGIPADLVTYGKIIGGGLPVGVVAGRAEFMRAVDGGAWNFGDDSAPGHQTTFVSGTFCNHPLTMAGMRAVLAHLTAEGPALQELLNRKTAAMSERLNAFFERHDLPAKMVSFSSLFRFTLQGDLELFYHQLIARGFYVWEGRNCFLSTAHTDTEIDAFVSAVQDTLIDLTHHGFGRRAATPQPDPGPASERYPMSSSQKRLFVLNALEGAEKTYHLNEAFVVDGPLDIPALRHAFASVIQAHESFRTGFETEAGAYWQRLHRQVPADLVYLDKTGQSPEALIPEMIQPFDTAQPPLIRLVVARLGENRHLCLFDVHHLVADGLAINFLVRDLLGCYAGKTIETPRAQYRHYADWHNAFLEGAEAERQERYWLETLAKDPPVLALPTDFPRPAHFDFSGGTVTTQLDPRRTSELKDFARKHGATPHMVLLSVYAVFLARLTGQEDLVIGVPFSGRQRPEFREVIGMLVNTLPLRLPVPRRDPFLTLLERVKRTTMEALANEDYPLERLLQKLKTPRDPGRNPLFDTMFEYEDGNPRAIQVETLSWRPVPYDRGTAMFDLDLEVVHADQRLVLNFNYSAGLFRRESILRYAECFRELVEQAIRAPDQWLGGMPMLTRAQETQLLQDWSRHEKALDLSVALHQLVERAAAKFPQHPALVWDQGEISYAELNGQANRLARCLTGLGVGPEQLVPIVCQRSPGMILGMLAVMKTGGAYVPLDPELPAAKLEALIRETGARVVLTQTSRLDSLQPHLGCVALDQPSAWSAPSDDPPDQPVHPDQAAYVLFTSGSTGEPKGVVISHRAAVNHILWYVGQFGVTDADVLLQKTTVTFDTSVSEIYAALVSGARLILPRPGEQADPRYIVSLIQTHRVTLLEDVPSFAELLAREPGFTNCPSLRWQNVGGEAFPKRLGQQLQSLGERRIANLYGPTEAAVDALFKVWEEDGSGETVSIGKPIWNLEAYILDPLLQPVPAGVVGELFLGGTGLARGYLHRPDLTAERFVPHPFSSRRGERLYRTGDLARHLPNGDVEFVGRVDHQVKIRGCRVELGAIERVLHLHPQVKQALVAALPDSQGATRLVAYYTRKSEFPTAELRRLATQELPAYMVPSVFVPLPDFPLTRSGKIDRRALPAPEYSAALGQRSLTRPRNPQEELIAGIWREILGLPEVGIEENFFDLGGHSLLATQVISRVRQALNVELSLRAIFENPTVAGLARAVKCRDSALGLPAPTPTCVAGLHPLCAMQKRLWTTCQIINDPAVYNMTEGYLFEGPLRERAFDEAIGDLAQQHEILRTVFLLTDEGPRQQILPAGTVTVEALDVSQETQGLERAIAIGQEEKHHVFDLAKGPLLRVKRIRLGEHRWVVIFNIHHVVFDAWSMRIVLDDLLALYQHRADINRPPGRSPALQYRDFAAWQNQLLDGGHLAKARAYWHHKLGGTVTPLEVPADFRRPNERTLRGTEVACVFDSAFMVQLARLAREQGVTPFMFFLAAVKAFLHRYTGQEDIWTGTLTAGRNRTEWESQIGCFLNSLVLRDTVSGTESFITLLHRVKQTVLEAYDFQDYPYDLLIDELRAPRDPGRNPMFDVVVNWMDPRLTGADFEDQWGDVRVRCLNLRRDESRFDLTFHFTDRGDRLELLLECSQDLFLPETAERMLRHFRRLAAALLAAPTVPLAHAPLVDGAERAHLLELGQTRGKAPRPPVLLHAWFEQMVERFPQRLAVSDGESRLTYAELNQEANRLAHYLRAQGVDREQPVGIYLDRDWRVALSILAILKAGGFYVPLDPVYPRERLAFMIEDSGMKWLLTTSTRAQEIPAHHCQVLCLNDGSKTDGFPEVNLPARGTPDNLAYVIYTSGSTGRPKGCQVTHANVGKLFASLENLFEMNERDVWTVFHSYAFDFTVWEMWGALLYGGRAVFVPYWIARSPAQFCELIIQEQVTVLSQTPSAFYQLLPLERLSAVSSLRYLILAAESLQFHHLEAWYATHLEHQTQLVNMYGITETTVYVTHRCLAREDAARGHRSLIGGPIPDWDLRLLDQNLEPVPIGVAGEIYVGGPGVTRGYLNRPDLTAAKFLPDPFSGSAGARLYRSGDLARWLPNGDLEYLGRADRQVQVRGHRVELGEIEGAIIESGAASAVAVVYRDGRLIGYWQPRTGVEGAEEKMRGRLRERLPGYMVPSLLVAVEALPMTANGKIDWARLPEAAPAPARPEGSPKVGARTEPERKLVALWEEVLGTREIGVEDNFFELGGDSILSIQVVARARREGLALSAQQIFEHPTIAELARVAGELGAGTAEPSWRGPIGLTPIQRWFFALGLTQPSHWNQSVMLKVPGEGLREEPLRQAVAALVRRHEMLRARFWLEAGEWRQEVLPEGAQDVLWVREAGSPEALRQVGEQAQTSLSLTAGRVFRALYVRWPGGPDRLLLVGHHLVVDGVSWRVLVEDLARGYEQASRGEAVRLEEGGASYGRWSQGLASYGTRAAVAAERARWREVARQRGDVPLDREGGANQVGSERGVCEVLAAGLTEQLLKGSWRQQGVSVDELLLSALALTLTEWNGDSGVKVDVEGHGRDEAVGVEVSRTVGWFTAIYPLWLERRGGVEATVLGVREARRSVGNGLGYGVLTYLAGGLGLAPGEARPSAVSFNYLGQVEAGQSGRFELGEESEGGALRNPAERREYVLEVGASVSRGQLEVHWSYSEDLHERPTVAHWARRYMDKLQEILACQPKAETPPAIVTGQVQGLSSPDLDNLLAHLPKPN